MMPSFFIAHGAPVLAIQDNAYTRAVAELGARYKPKAAVLFSAHWESRTQQVSGVERYRTIHDFGGFPDELYQIQYPAAGDAGLTGSVSRLLTEAGVSFQVDRQRGLDHGAWVVLRMLYPQADVPVVAMSVNPHLAPHEQYRIGQALSSLRASDVMVIGSGGTVHNFGTINFGAPAGVGDDWAVRFDDWLLDRMTQWDLKSLFAYEALAPEPHLAVPPHGREHFIPLFYAMGAADDQRVVKQLHRSYDYGNLSHAVWQFGE
jgi:4,5-DOPA dioxygenase extradiol